MPVAIAPASGHPGMSPPARHPARATTNSPLVSAALRRRAHDAPRARLHERSRRADPTADAVVAPLAPVTQDVLVACSKLRAARCGCCFRARRGAASGALRVALRPAQRRRGLRRRLSHHRPGGTAPRRCRPCGSSPARHGLDARRCHQRDHRRHQGACRHYRTRRYRLSRCQRQGHRRRRPRFRHLAAPRPGSAVVASVSFVPGDSRTTDSFGHGTHIAGTHRRARAGRAAHYQGVASRPARISSTSACSAPMAAATRAACIAGIHWVIANRAGTASASSTSRSVIRVIEPVRDRSAVPARSSGWSRAGLVVVASAGNRGMAPSGQLAVAAPSPRPATRRSRSPSARSTPGAPSTPATTRSPATARAVRRPSTCGSSPTWSLPATRSSRSRPPAASSPPTIPSCTWPAPAPTPTPR